jgi:Tfp pilus assembly protein PilE
MHKRLSRGFTIVEIATVIFIIALLAVLTLVVFNNVQAQSRDTSRANDMAILGNLLERYYDKNGQYPPACGSPTCSSGSSLWAYSAPDTISVSSTLAQMSTIFGQTVSTIDPQLSGSQTPIIGQWYTTSNAPGYIYRGGQTNTPPNSSAVTIYLIKLIESGSSRQCTVNVTINGTSGTDTAGYVLTYYAESTKTWNVYFGKHGAKPFIDPSSTAGFCQAMN